ncbi:MAG: phosphoribosyltransferase [Neobacillus sp.]|nr:phosphoribosyltransferase [Neobacillus sp.]
MNPFPQEYCLLCNKIIRTPIGWSSLFAESKERVICPECDVKLERINGERCKICSRPLQLLAEKFYHGDTCHDCIRWEEDLNWKGYLNLNVSLFLYNDFFKKVLARFKFRGDYVLTKIFSSSINEALGKMKFDMLVPIPLSAERLYERGFNQSESLIIESGHHITPLLTRIHAEKQSKKSRSERIHLAQVFQLASNIEVKGKRLVLVDDIYTTGSTLRHAAKLLKEAGAQSVQSLTLAR